MKLHQNKPIAHLSLLANGLLVRLMLRTLGFQRTLNLLAARPTSNHHTTMPLTSRMPYLTCLEDSLAKIKEIRKAGHGATLFIGVMGQEQDYKFHAWLQEHDGKDVALKFVKMNPENINSTTENRSGKKDITQCKSSESLSDKIST
ncbi:MAG TPA: lasso peptide biosynthesis protein [Candidatus Saccharimonadales bacterium]|nr:lasso peptide biosynthesis protein [Candidatus Saccharimonadales bacterium]